MTRTGVCFVAGIAACVFAVAGCGSSTSSSPSASATGASGSPNSPATASSSTAAPQPAKAAPQPAVNGLQAAEHPAAGDFPAARGRSLQQLASHITSSAQFGAATGTFTPGVRRLAFGLTERSGSFIYGPTAVYIAKNPNSPAMGPILAPADPMTTTPQYRSQENEGPGGLQAIYAARIPVPHRGTYAVLTLTRTRSGLIGSPTEVKVAASSPIPDVGQRPPAIATDTLATTNGNVRLLTTRIPPESMHSVSFNKVLGKRPIALLFSTPQLCISKVCGPVTDIAVSLQHQFAGRITFIHEEVYVDNQPSKGLRPQLKAFHLETEPWLFTINRKGVITTRLEGAFGVNAFRAALESALS